MSSIGIALSVFVRLTNTDTPTRRAPTNALRCGTLHYILGNGGRVGRANIICSKIQGGRRGGRAPSRCDTKKGSPERRMTPEGVRAEDTFERSCPTLVYPERCFWAFKLKTTGAHTHSHILWHACMCECACVGSSRQVKTVFPSRHVIPTQSFNV